MNTLELIINAPSTYYRSAHKAFDVCLSSIRCSLCLLALPTTLMNIYGDNETETEYCSHVCRVLYQSVSLRLILSFGNSKL